MRAFMMQTHLNGLAERYSQDRVKQARSYLKSIFDEAIEQEYLIKDPTRKLRIPTNLRLKDKQVLSWEQLRLILAKAGRRDRLLLMLDMTEALRPSELFALRWQSFDDQNTLDLTETVYRRTLRPFGKTPGSLTKVHLYMQELPGERTGDGRIGVLDADERRGKNVFRRFATKSRKC
jgi:integrase